MAKHASNQAQPKKEKMALIFMPVKSPKTGAYTFIKKVLPKDAALQHLTKRA